MDLYHLYLLLVLSVWLYISLWFLLAHILQRADVIDSAWGIGFVVIAWISLNATGHHDLPRIAAALLVSFWGLRLAAHILRRNWHKAEDYRYQAYKEKWGEWFWAKAYVRIFLTQGFLMLLISTPVIAIMSASQRAQPIVATVGFVVWIAAIWFESTADRQLRQFLRRKDRTHGAIMTGGLWKYSRHPNYFGEISAWWGAAIVAIAYGQWWGIAGALVITFLITVVSGVPILEKHYATNTAYQTYKRHTSVLIPLPVRK